MVSGADLDPAEGVKLCQVTKNYTNLNVKDYLDEVFLARVPTSLKKVLYPDRTTIAINKREIDGEEDYFFTVEAKFLEGPACVNSLPLDKGYCEEVLSKCKYRTLRKRSFSFKYLNTKYLLDVYPDKYGGDAILSVGSKNGKTLVAIPKFTLVTREVTTDTKYYEMNRAR